MYLEQGKRGLLLALCGSVLLLCFACKAGDDPVISADDDSTNTPLPEPLCLGSVYGPDVAVINPDNPDYEGDGYTHDEVAQLFTEARAANNQAYRAYRAAYEHPDVVQCAFCLCGCASSVDHVSAEDCFKDLHGFT